jgi:hypothetical protein
MGKPKISIVKLNNVWAKIVTEDSKILSAAYKKFEVPVDNYWFMPSYKSGKWDGKIRFVETDGKFYVGNFKRICKYVYDDEFHEMEIDPDLIPEASINASDFREEFLQHADSLESKLTPYVHQLRGALKACYYKRGICRHVTSAGKSFTIALTIHYLLKENPNHKILLMVPKIDLVEQFVENLEEYGIPTDLVGKYFGFQKDEDAQILVSTWQSIHKKKDLLKKFTVLISDECLHPDSMISMSDGTKKKIKDINEGDMVITKNETTGEIENNPVLEVYHNMSLDQQMYEIELDNGNIIKITGNHKVMLTDGSWKRVDELNGDEDLECHDIIT